MKYSADFFISLSIGVSYEIAKQRSLFLAISYDLNGGLSFIPRYYAGNNIVVDIWNAEEMEEILTEEYFSLQTIKDQQSYQKLRKVLKNLKDDDNPVVVVAQLRCSLHGTRTYKIIDNHMTLIYC